MSRCRPRDPDDGERTRAIATQIAVIGATGHVGYPLVEQLLAKGVRVRAIARRPERLQPLAARGAEPRAGSVLDPKFLAEAFRTADGVFAMIPPDTGHPDPRMRDRAVTDAIGAALQVARVRHAVTLSSIGADLPDQNGPIAGLYLLEQKVNAVPGMNAVHLRAGYFHENFLNSIGLIKSAGINGGRIRPDVPMAMVATRDIAAAAAGLLVDPSFSGQRARELQGPRDYTMQEVTTILGAAVGRPDLKYVQFSETDFVQALQAAGFSPAAAALFAEMSEALNSGLIKPQPRTRETTTPTTLEEFAREVFAPAFQR